MDEPNLEQDHDGAKLERQITKEENEAIRHPGDVRINVKGAFIVDEEVDTTAEESGTPPGVAFDDNGYQHDSKDIRLPNHKAVVSHMAVDVSYPAPNLGKHSIGGQC
jgi:type II pantothenate kinase